MTHEELEEASRAIEEAAESASAAVHDRLREQAAQLAELAGRERGPDHGRLARHQQALRDIREGVDGAVAESVDRANELIDEYRETLEGV